jgi:SAM-dependent methyltransferase
VSSCSETRHGAARRSGVTQRAADRFTDRVDDYVRARPGYPDALVELLAAELGLLPPAPVADIGSGTGLSAEPLLRRGHVVYCVEPNAAMRAAAEARLGGLPGFRSIDGAAERTRLPDAAVDVVLAAQAFHWFEPDRACAEFRRILVPGGRVVLVWNTRRTRGSPFLEGFEALLRRHGTDYDAVRARTAALMAEAARGGGLARLFAGGVAHRVLANAQTLDREGLRRRLRSASYTPPPGSPAHPAMMAELDALFAAHASDGAVRIDYDLDVYWGVPG